MRISFCLLIFAIAVVTSCSSPVSVKIVDPPAPASLAANPGPEDAGLLLDRIALAQRKLDSARPETFQSYNYLVARLIDQLVPTEANNSGKVFPIKGAEKTYRLTIKAPKDLINEAYTIIPVDRLEFSGEYAVEAHQIIQGMGAPVVARKKNATLNPHPHQVPYRLLTAVLDANRSSPVLRLIDPYAQEKVSLPRVTTTLSADFNAAYSFGVSETRLAEILFREEDHEAAAAARESIVAPAQRSEAAKKKDQSKRSSDGEHRVQSFQSLLDGLGALSRVTCRPKIKGIKGAASIRKHPDPTPLQRRVLDLLQVPSPVA